LYGCENSSLRLRVFKTRVLRRIFGPKKDKVIRQWRRLHNEELYMYSSPNRIEAIKSRRMTWGGGGHGLD
jgi:hypothetical protein